MVSDEAAGATPSPLLRYAGMTARPDFLRAARGRRHVTPGFVLQAWNRKDADLPRVGFTCSKKVGNAVARNRAKRRLREVVRSVLPTAGRTGWDYVLIGRSGVTASRGFAQMQRDFAGALAALHSPKS